MLSFDTLCRLVYERKCAKSARALEIDEYVVSRSAFPSLYGGGSNSKESEFLLDVCTHIPAMLALDSSLRSDIQGFMQIVLRNGSMHSEEFLHRYLYEFWIDLERPEQGLEMKESYFKCHGSPTNSPFFRDVVRRVHEKGRNIPDILGCTNANSILIVEIKNEELDDRALGQILRYYHVVRTVCDRYFVHRDSCRVIPLLVAPSCALGFWDSIPFHFREVLEIYYWRVSSDGKVHLVDGKRSLRDSARTRLFQST